MKIYRSFIMKLTATTLKLLSSFTFIYFFKYWWQHNRQQGKEITKGRTSHEREQRKPKQQIFRDTQNTKQECCHFILAHRCVCKRSFYLLLTEKACKLESMGVDKKLLCNLFCQPQNAMWSRARAAGYAENCLNTLASSLRRKRLSTSNNIRCPKGTEWFVRIDVEWKLARPWSGYFPQREEETERTSNALWVPA